ncbi:Agamous-like MADS-box protein AGL61 [Capsicum chinense]|nr:Agamous-like MADS-box protein AGL61 [Capsicum chinense]
MENKKGKGRQKIPMKKIEKQDDRYVTFSKRRSGLYKKASELVKECDVDIGMIFFSPTGNPFAFFHPTVDAVVSRFQNPDLKLSESTQLVAAQARNRVNGLQSGLDELDLREDIAIANKNVYDKVLETTQKKRIDEGEQRTIARAHTSSSNGEDRKVIISPKLSWADEIEAMEVDVPKVRKFLSILLKRWDSKVNAITEAKDLNKMVMDELIGNPKTYEMLKKLRKLKDEPKAEKYLVLNAAKDIPSAEDK